MYLSLSVYVVTYWISVCKRYVIFPIEIKMKGTGKQEFKYCQGPTVANTDSAWGSRKTWEDFWSPVCGSADWREYRLAKINCHGATSKCGRPVVESDAYTSGIPLYTVLRVFEYRQRTERPEAKLAQDSRWKLEQWRVVGRFPSGGEWRTGQEVQGF